MNKNSIANNQPFKVKDCTLIVRMGGVAPAMNLRELRDRTAICPIECLYHHFCETLIRPSFDDPEFRNDFAVWASRQLRDRVLAEQLAIINPFAFEDIEQMRTTIVEVIDERLDEVHYVPWVAKGEEFRFLQALTIVFDTGLELKSPADFIKKLPNLSYNSLYYHFIEARRRTPEKTDDFTAWMKKFGKKPDRLIKALERIDFYFLNLAELKTALYNATLDVQNGDLFDG
jgi:hypothetical protein